MAQDKWAKLTRIDIDQAGDSCNDDVDVDKDIFLIGRSSDCDLSFPSNKLVSQIHCKISRDEDGQIYLADSSTNGTLVDGTKVKKDKIPLNHGDEIHLVFKKNGTENNIAYVFQEVKKLPPEETLEATQDYNALDSPSHADGIESEGPPSKQMKLDNTVADDQHTSKASEEKPRDDSDEIEETLLCSICQEILHDCVSLQPCLHSFCAGCLSQWIGTSNYSCPTCRKRSTSVAQNHILRNLIEIYLKSHPDKKRQAKDIEDLDKANIIKQQIMKLSGTFGHSANANYDSGSDGYSEDSADDDDGIDFVGFVPARMNGNIPVCRQCPGYDASRTIFGGLPSTTNPVASTSNRPAAPDYQCTQGSQPHIVCYCCMQPFPDRRGTITTPVNCSVCQGVFCHQYWSCTRPGCSGCLAPLKDLEFENSCLNGILLSNVTESNILKDYLQSKGLSTKDLLSQTVAQLDRGEVLLNNDFGCNFLGHNIRGDTVICYKCGLKALRQLAYHYRKSIPPEELPESVTNKEDCYWGKNCRTLNKRPHHAQRWNHICEQTRFS